VSTANELNPLLFKVLELSLLLFLELLEVLGVGGALILDIIKPFS
jgi:hypothetical protein